MTTLELARTIDKINFKFQQHVQAGSVHTQCPPDAMFAGYYGSADLTKTPLVCTMWNRRYDLIKRPTNQNGYNLVYVHGHDSQDPDQHATHVCNLDMNNNLGKSPHHNKGAYAVIINNRNLRWSRYLVIDFSHPWLKSTRQRAKCLTPTVLRPARCAERASVCLPQ